MRLIYRPDTETQTAIVSDALARRGRLVKIKIPGVPPRSLSVYFDGAVAKFYL